MKEDMKYVVWAENWHYPRVCDSKEVAQELAEDEVAPDRVVYIIEASQMWSYYIPEPNVRVEKEF